MTIGVIGGNGVAATNRLCDMVERKVTEGGAFRDAHHPEMIVWQATNVPSRSMFLEGRGPDWRPQYVEIARHFKSLGCDLACMCCNTAHYAIDDIVEGAGIPFINLLQVVAEKVKSLRLAKIEMWVSDGARKHDIYGAAFRQFAPECEMLYPSIERQKLVTRVICAVKTNARFLPIDAPEHPQSMIRELLEKAQAPVVLGCTDLRIAYRDNESLAAGIVVDSLECLADYIVGKVHLAKAS